MTSWKNEQEFIEDRCLLSEFYYSENNEPDKKFVFKSKTPKEKTLQSLYFDSDSEEEVPDLDTEPTSNVQVFNDIRQQIRNVIGHRYSNAAIESYYNVERNARNSENRTSSENLTTVPGNSINNNIPTKATNSKKSLLAENSPKSVGNRKQYEASKQSSSTSSISSTPRKRYRNGRSGDPQCNKSPKRSEFRNGANYKPASNDYKTYFNQSTKKNIDINSTKEFPRL